MDYKTTQYFEFETLVARYTRMGKLLADLRTIRSMHANQIRHNTLSLTVTIVSSPNSLDNHNELNEKSIFLDLPSDWCNDMWEFVFRQYISDMHDLALHLNLDWTDDYILNTLTKI
jgi:hypothetical protein